MVKALLSNPLFCETLEHASGAAKAVNASSSKWIKILYDIIEHYYGKGIAVTISKLARQSGTRTRRALHPSYLSDMPVDNFAQNTVHKATF